MKLSVVIPAHNEVDSIVPTLEAVTGVLEREEIEHEVLVVDDASGDGTGDAVARYASRKPAVRCLMSHYPSGFGFAVRAGLERFRGDAVAVMMADSSDDPEDLLLYYRLLEKGYDCAFGSRFVPGAHVHDYPLLKLAINRAVNTGIRILFRHRYNDTTNAFKAYRREVIQTVQPLMSNHFNLTVELPLKALVRGHSYAVVPVSWTNRTTGTSKLSLQEMGSRYLFINLYAIRERYLSRGDYRRPGFVPEPRWRQRFPALARGRLWPLGGRARVTELSATGRGDPARRPAREPAGVG
jgi:dolichol-phosphate mannosyltransferase